MNGVFDMSIEDIIDEAIMEVGRKYGAICAFKYISQAGAVKKLQIGFLFREKEENEKFHKIFSEISERLREFNLEIEVIILNKAPLATAYIIIRDGTEIYCDDIEQTRRFKSRLIEKYLDFREEVQGYIQVSFEKARGS